MWWSGCALPLQLSSARPGTAKGWEPTSRQCPWPLPAVRGSEGVGVLRGSSPAIRRGRQRCSGTTTATQREAGSAMESSPVEHVSAVTHRAAPLPGLLLCLDGTWLPSPEATGPGAGSTVPRRPEGERAKHPAAPLPSAMAAQAPPSTLAFLTRNGRYCKFY